MDFLCDMCDTRGNENEKNYDSWWILMDLCV